MFNDVIPGYLCPASYETDRVWDTRLYLLEE
jgi:hypothetical protein